MDTIKRLHGHVELTFLQMQCEQLKFNNFCDNNLSGYRNSNR